MEPRISKNSIQSVRVPRKMQQLTQSEEINAFCTPSTRMIRVLEEGSLVPFISDYFEEFLHP